MAPNHDNLKETTLPSFEGFPSDSRVWPIYMSCAVAVTLLSGSDSRFLSVLSFQAAAADNTKRIANITTTNTPIHGFAEPTYLGFVEVGHHLGVSPKLASPHSQMFQKLIWATQVHIITIDVMDRVVRDIHCLARRAISTGIKKSVMVAAVNP